MQGKSQREVASSVDLNSSYITQSQNQVIFNGLTLKPNSPRTVLACQKLGIDMGIFQIKQQDAPLIVIEISTIFVRMIVAVMKQFKQDMSITLIKLIVKFNNYFRTIE
ncbi:unnamed protein product (macronuclear) [Paramecium tetraurelia]|uniref:HTH cro/C1-type domain-containing protein n=1 Tax=Paramecium tetraurelia TaxID=5888 RepID=A0ECZ6_PARTE|nr:uncharacterized protein GSPATT00004032001 [Paramecium tetraurelia]CAK93163.1 unnamed protein product [Paramecium tetraurelia]|eukprot:XP_001460560.1 hypothetical protein (macronuclear) [Paramecium tetraurelia strain d4-2]